ncbi:TPA: hypothetical protein N0F65_006161 [Lagenidium giganteum]|uniref:Uncharacterized protein n=1 Tax=Lagenidium giganteum TaxID=4803 RepID=A0AAV2Z7H9_9STRA|nr:TPA: hypothetical protein N0F65_006161 [Lagenidium giganteum]
MLVDHVFKSAIKPRDAMRHLTRTLAPMEVFMASTLKFGVSSIQTAPQVVNLNRRLAKHHLNAILLLR